MSDEELMTMMLAVDPYTKRIPPAVRRLAAYIEEAERKRLAIKLQETIDLEGFGCACEPNRQCDTCRARSVLSKMLTPIIKELMG